MNLLGGVRDQPLRFPTLYARLTQRSLAEAILNLGLVTSLPPHPRGVVAVLYRLLFLVFMTRRRGRVKRGRRQKLNAEFESVCRKIPLRPVLA